MTINKHSFQGVAGDVKLIADPSDPTRQRMKLKLRVSTLEGAFPVVVDDPTDDQRAIANGQKVYGIGQVRTVYSRIDTFTAANVVTVASELVALEQHQQVPA